MLQNLNIHLYLSMYKAFIILLAWKILFLKGLSISEIEYCKFWGGLFSLRCFDFMKNSTQIQAVSYLRKFLSLAILSMTLHGWSWLHLWPIGSSNHHHLNSYPWKIQEEKLYWFLVGQWSLFLIESMDILMHKYLTLFSVQETVNRTILAKIRHNKQINQHMLHSGQILVLWICRC